MVGNWKKIRKGNAVAVGANSIHLVSTIEANDARAIFNIHKNIIYIEKREGYTLKRAKKYETTKDNHHLNINAFRHFSSYLFCCWLRSVRKLIQCIHREQQRNYQSNKNHSKCDHISCTKI